MNPNNLSEEEPAVLDLETLRKALEKMEEIEEHHRKHLKDLSWQQWLWENYGEKFEVKNGEIQPFTQHYDFPIGRRITPESYPRITW